MPDRVAAAAALPCRAPAWVAATTPTLASGVSAGAATLTSWIHTLERSGGGWSGASSGAPPGRGLASESRGGSGGKLAGGWAGGRRAAAGARRGVGAGSNEQGPPGSALVPDYRWAAGVARW